MKLLRKEIVILKRVSYDVNIVQFYGACTTEPAMLVMEYMEVRLTAGFTAIQHCCAVVERSDDLVQLTETTNQATSACEGWHQGQG